MLKAPYCWQRHRVQWTRGYCRAVLQWFSNCIGLSLSTAQKCRTARLITYQ